MKNKFTKTILSTVVLLGFIGILTSGCRLFSDKDNAENKIDSLSKLDTGKSISKLKTVFFALPSPIEIAMVTKGTGAPYNESILNPIDNYTKYNTTKALALNLGVYSADLSYASIYEQTQITVKYMSISKKIADRLGILQAIDDSVIIKLEKSVNDPYTTSTIISKTFLNSNSYLKENNRPETAGLILTGGWIEDLYIQTQLYTSAKNKNKMLLDKILDLRLSISQLISLLEDTKENIDIKSLLGEIYGLQKVFDKIKVETSKVEPQINTANNTTTLHSKVTTKISDEDLKELCDKVNKIRASFIQ